MANEKFKVVQKTESEAGYEIRLNHVPPTGSTPTPGVGFGGTIAISNLDADRAANFPVGAIFELAPVN